MVKCGTECRDEIIDKIDRKIGKSGMWKFVSVIAIIFGLLWTTAFSITDKLGEKVNKTAENIARMEEQISNLDSSVKTLLWEIREKKQ